MGGILSENIIAILSRRVKIYIFPERVVLFRCFSAIISVLWPSGHDTSIFYGPFLFPSGEKGSTADGTLSPSL